MSGVWLDYSGRGRISFLFRDLSKPFVGHLGASVAYSEKRVGHW